MLSKTEIQKLKRTNISVDPEKTKGRVHEAWKSASREDKQGIEELAGIVRSTIARVYKTGVISAKVAVPMAQTLNVDPSYLIGETDNPGACTEEGLRLFLAKHKYEELVPHKPRAVRKPRKKALKDEPKEAEVVVTLAEPVAVLAEPSQGFADSLTEEEAILLLRSVLLRAKSGGKYAELAEKIKALLLS